MNEQDPKSVEEIRIYNRSTRQTLQHGNIQAPPSAFVTVPSDVAKNWMRLFPDIIIEAGIAQKEIGGATAELALERAEHAKTKEKVARLEARIAELTGVKKPVPAKTF